MKTAECLVDIELDFDFAKVTVISPTKNRIKFALGNRLSMSLMQFKSSYSELYNKLEIPFSKMGFHKVELTYAEMLILQDISKL